MNLGELWEWEKKKLPGKIRQVTRGPVDSCMITVVVSVRSIVQVSSTCMKHASDWCGAGIPAGSAAQYRVRCVMLVLSTMWYRNSDAGRTRVIVRIGRVRNAWKEIPPCTSVDYIVRIVGHTVWSVCSMSPFLFTCNCYLLTGERQSCRR